MNKALKATSYLNAEGETRFCANWIDTNISSKCQRLGGFLTEECAYDYAKLRKMNINLQNLLKELKNQQKKEEKEEEKNDYNDGCIISCSIS